MASNATGPRKEQRLGDILLAAGRIDAPLLAQAIELQQAGRKQPLGELLVELGVPETDVLWGLAFQYRLKPCCLAGRSLAPEGLHFLSPLSRRASGSLGRAANRVRAASLGAAEPLRLARQRARSPLAGPRAACHRSAGHHSAGVAHVAARLVSAPPPPRTGSGLLSHVRDMEIELIRQALIESQGNLAAAARKLELSPSTLRDRVRKYSKWLATMAIDARGGSRPARVSAADPDASNRDSSGKDLLLVSGGRSRMTLKLLLWSMVTAGSQQRELISKATHSRSRASSLSARRRE